MLIKEIFVSEKNLINTNVELNGWINTHRLQTNLLFISLNDGSILSNIQIVFEFTKDQKQEYNDLLSKLYKGVSLNVKGILIESPGKGQKYEVKSNLEDLTILGEIDPLTFPMAKGRLGVDFIRGIPQFRTRTNLGTMMLRIRNCCSFATHKFFNEREFINIHTPLITSNDCEGAGETFEINNSKNNFFEDNKTYLTVSGQLHAESLALGMGRVYTFGPTFRAENSNTSRHLAEFWMVEPEICFISMDELMSLGEDYIKFCIKEVFDKCNPDIEFVNKLIKKGQIEFLKSILDNPFTRLSYTDSINILKKKYKEIKWGDDLSTEQEKYLTEKYGSTIVYNYPKKIKSFYMKEIKSENEDEDEDEDEKTVMAFDILVPGIGEIIGGSMREDNYDKLKKNMDEKNISNLDWYLELRRQGSVPHGGFGLGFERLIMLISGLTNIKDTISYPRYPNYCFA